MYLATTQIINGEMSCRFVPAHTSDRGFKHSDKIGVYFGSDIHISLELAEAEALIRAIAEKLAEATPIHPLRADLQRFLDTGVLPQQGEC